MGREGRAGGALRTGGHGWVEGLAGIGQRAGFMSMPFKKVAKVSGKRSHAAPALTGAAFHNTRVLKEVSIWWIAEISWQPRPRLPWGARKPLDRKSTRLNSSHLGISYAVF